MASQTPTDSGSSSAAKRPSTTATQSRSHFDEREFLTAWRNTIRQLEATRTEEKTIAMNLPKTPDELEAFGRENWARLMFLKEETKFLEKFRSEQIKQAQDYLASLPDSKASAFQSRLASKRIVLSDEGYESKGTGVAPTAVSN